MIMSMETVDRLVENKCPTCGAPIQWYSGGFGASWYDAEYGRCSGTCKGTVSPINPNWVVSFLRRAVRVAVRA